MAEQAEFEAAIVSEADAGMRLLADESLEHTPFQAPEWLNAWFAIHQPDGIDCKVAVVRRRGDERPLLLLPLVRERRYGLDILTLPDRGVSDYHAALLRPDLDLDAATADRLWSALADALPAADALVIERMLPESAKKMGLAHRSRLSKFTAHALPIDTDFATVREKRFDPSTARRLVRMRRKLSNKGKLTFDLLTGEEAIEDLDRLLAWRRERFQEFNDPAQEAVQSAFYHRLVRDGSLARVGRLCLDGKMVGGCLGIVDHGRILMLAVAYDLHFSNWAPGLLTLESCMEKAAELGLTVFDLTIGDETYKTVFGVDTVELREFQLPLSLRGRLTLAVVNMKPRLKHVLERTGLIRLVRRRKPCKAHCQPSSEAES